MTMSERFRAVAMACAIVVLTAAACLMTATMAACGDDIPPRADARDAGACVYVDGSTVRAVECPDADAAMVLR